MSADLAAQALLFETERLRMRPLETGDERLFLKLYTDPETMRFIGKPLSPERASRFFLKIVASATKDPPDCVFLAIQETSTQRPIGVCAISRFDAGMTRAEVGIMLESNARSRGYAREGLGGLVRQTFRVFPVDEIWVQCSALNPVVERMVGSIGFRLCDGSAIDAGPLKQRIWSVHRPS